ncbi:MAG: PD-(D/E)XK nuclease family protein, partial [Pseudomonadota bacterium]
ADADAGGAVDGRALGDAVHALLERLPAIAPAERAAAAHAIASDALGAQAAELALRVLAAPEAGWIFGPDSLAEVDLSAELAALGGGAILGRVDRLIVAPQTVTAVDLKTNAQVPPHAQAVPEGILRQMGAYQAALERVFPDRRVDVALLWAGAADPAHMLMRLPRDLVLAALRRAGAVVAR